MLALRMKKAVRRGATLVVADPRKIWLTKIAAKHLQLRPGTDVWLLNAIMHTILEEGLDASVSETVARVASLRRQIASQSGLLVAYQPIVSLTDGTVHHLEALGGRVVAEATAHLGQHPRRRPAGRPDQEDVPEPLLVGAAG